MRVFVLSLITVLGLLVVLVSGYYLLVDWATLTQSYAQFEQRTSSSADLRSLFIAEAQQNAFRINCFAEGVGVLLGAVLSALGLHGLCLLPREDRDVTRRREETQPAQLKNDVRL